MPEQIGFRFQILIHGSVPVQVIGLEIREYRHVSCERFTSFSFWERVRKSTFSDTVSHKARNLDNDHSFRKSFFTDLEHRFRKGILEIPRDEYFFLSVELF